MIADENKANEQEETSITEELAEAETPQEIPQKAPKKPEKKPKQEKKQGINEKSKPALLYVIIMFSVALLLLVLSFFMQQRNHGDLLNEINTASMNMQTIVDLELELETMEDSLIDLQEEYDDMKVSYDKSLADSIASKESLSAMENLLILQTLYLNGNDEEAKILLTEMEAQKTYIFLSAESTSSDVDAPFTIYEKIKANLK